MGETDLTVHHGLPSCIRAGEILGGKYRLERELGRGAMGTVWSATHLTLGQRVAIKLISAEHAQSAEARARFSTEAKAAAQLRSRHVVRVYDDGETPHGTPFIVMEYLEGESLEARLERENDVPLVDAVRITAQVARALARAHSRRVIHRDLKPGNIFLARNDDDELGWTAKVLDFGIAKVEEQRDVSTTKTGTVLGTPLFMSPEQIRRASSVDSRADLYSLGMCFYNMVTGHQAFESESFGDILVSVCTEDLPDIRALAPWLSDGVAAWFQRCCARDPNERFQSADELVEALGCAVGGSLPLVNRRSSPDTAVGPYGTLKGHSAPRSGHAEVIGTEDSGTFTRRSSAALEAPGKWDDDRTREAEAPLQAGADILPAQPRRRRPVLTGAMAVLAVAAMIGLGLTAIGAGTSPKKVTRLPVVYGREISRGMEQERAPLHRVQPSAETRATTSRPVHVPIAGSHVAPATSASGAPLAAQSAAPSNKSSTGKPKPPSARRPAASARRAKAEGTPDLGF